MHLPTNRLIAELKDRPYTMVTVLALCAFSVWGYANFALAEDVEAIRTEVRKEISRVTKAVGANAKNIDRVLKLQIAEAIRGQHRALCASDDAQYLENVQSLIDQLEEDYKALNDGIPYPLPACR